MLSPWIQQERGSFYSVERMKPNSLTLVLKKLGKKYASNVLFLVEMELDKLENNATIGIQLVVLTVLYQRTMCAQEM